jgi:hypothetical protein
VPYNVPTVTTNDISFGPAVLFMGVAGATPSTQVGSISEDGVTVEMTSEKRYISQGNPRTPVYAFSQVQGVMTKFTSIEWDFDNFVRAIGAGVTTVSGAEETFSWGGDPLVTQVAFHIQHYMAVTGNTMNVYVWKATSEGGLNVPFGQDEHSFEMNFTSLNSDTDWGGSSLAATQRLIKFIRTL